ncbi:hypothetical protein FCM35_KLT04066 [Carex littledalei]|uniref:CCHC-type domain-containing protein n=1 Tax=Carex littledalei TaxID=544730 RepID=A0A833R1T3_9POAL|nr:hypothetical protein FCM35_KLT04066 [Carex littledalei]
MISHRVALMRERFLHQFGQAEPMTNSNPPLMADPKISAHFGLRANSRISYSQAVQKLVQVWQARNQTVRVASKSTIVRNRIAEIRAASTSQHPICMKVGDKGHLAKTCRNKQVCFACNRLGHRASDCRTQTTHPPFSPCQNLDWVRLFGIWWYHLIDDLHHQRTCRLSHR